MDVYTNQFHSGHLYLRIGEREADSLPPSRFDALIDEYRKPLQVMVPSNAAGTIRLLREAGFVLKRRCYEMDVQASDLRVPLPARPRRLMTAREGTPMYDVCAEGMYAHYAKTHLSVNPLTASLPSFTKMLPDIAIYLAADGTAGAAAFVEGNEIAYLWAGDDPAFRAFADPLLFELFHRHDRICFEADDTDPIAMKLKAMFFEPDGPSCDTYIKPVHL